MQLLLRRLCGVRKAKGHSSLYCEPERKAVNKESAQIQWTDAIQSFLVTQRSILESATSECSETLRKVDLTYVLSKNISLLEKAFGIRKSKIKSIYCLNDVWLEMPWCRALSLYQHTCNNTILTVDKIVMKIYSKKDNADSPRLLRQGITLTILFRRLFLFHLALRSLQHVPLTPRSAPQKEPDTHGIQKYLLKWQCVLTADQEALPNHSYCSLNESALLKSRGKKMIRMESICNKSPEEELIRLYFLERSLSQSTFDSVLTCFKKMQLTCSSVLNVFEKVLKYLMDGLHSRILTIQASKLLAGSTRLIHVSDPILTLEPCWYHTLQLFHRSENRKNELVDGLLPSRGVQICVRTACLQVLLSVRRNCVQEGSYVARNGVSLWMKALSMLQIHARCEARTFHCVEAQKLPVSYHSCRQVLEASLRHLLASYFAFFEENAASRLGGVYWVLRIMEEYRVDLSAHPGVIRDILLFTPSSRDALELSARYQDRWNSSPAIWEALFIQCERWGDWCGALRAYQNAKSQGFLSLFASSVNESNVSTTRVLAWLQPLCELLRLNSVSGNVVLGLIHDVLQTSSYGSEQDAQLSTSHSRVSLRVEQLNVGLSFVCLLRFVTSPVRFKKGIEIFSKIIQFFQLPINLSALETMIQHRSSSLYGIDHFVDSQCFVSVASPQRDQNETIISSHAWSTFRALRLCMFPLVCVMPNESIQSVHFLTAQFVRNFFDRMRDKNHQCSKEVNMHPMNGALNKIPTPGIIRLIYSVIPGDIELGLIFLGFLLTNRANSVEKSIAHIDLFLQRLDGNILIRNDKTWPTALPIYGNYDNPSELLNAIPFTYRSIRRDIQIGLLRIEKCTNRHQGWCINVRLFLDSLLLSTLRLNLLASAPRRKLSAADSLIILYEDDDMWIIYKPAGISVSKLQNQDNFASNLTMNVLPLLYVDVGNNDVPLSNGSGLVHRIDSDTSGPVIFAKNEHTLHYLWNQFACQSVEREYTAILHRARKGGDLLFHLDTPTSPSEDVNFPLNDQPWRILRSSTHTDGTHDSCSPDPSDSSVAEMSVAAFQLLRPPFGPCKNFAFVRILLLTGKRHQIRKSFHNIGWNVLGDPLYGPAAVTASPLLGSTMKIALEATRISVQNRTNGRVDIHVSPSKMLMNAVHQISSARVSR